MAQARAFAPGNISCVFKIVADPDPARMHSLGMGFTLMLKLVDRLWLSTGPEGTVVQLEKLVHEPEIEDAGLLLAMERLP